MYRSLFTYIIVFLITPLLLIFSSCRKNDTPDPDPSLKLEFSTDTIIFDTVFTTVGTVTQELMVYNRNKSRVNISSIRLGSGGTSNYRINIDGDTSAVQDNVEIDAGDSLFIFIKITIDPTNQNLPLVITDSLLFNTNNNLQDVKLVAWGQDAIFHKSEELHGIYTWDSLKPHVIYGHLRVDTSGSLTILAGSKIYFHKDSYMVVSQGASLKIDGTLEHPVRFQGDRTDPYYRDLPGQWQGIYLEKGSIQNEIDYAIIKNGINGILVDSASVPGTPMLKLNNTIIKNMTGDGIYAYASSIVSENCVIGDCGRTAFSADFGGDYQFRQLTVGNYWSSSVRNSASIYLSNYTFLENKVFNPLTQAYFGNVIIYGSQEEEIQLDLDASVQGEYTFDHSILKTSLSFNDANRFISCERNTDPLFIDTQVMNYMLDTLSPAINKGIPMGIPLDIRGIDRGDQPDLGAYERE